MRFNTGTHLQVCLVLSGIWTTNKLVSGTILYLPHFRNYFEPFIPERATDT